MKLSDSELRQYARVGALETARRAVSEFPDILADLNRLARNGDGVLAGEASARPRRPARPAPLEAEASARPAGQHTRWKMSAAGRRAIAAGQRKRWQKYHAAKKGGAR